MLYDLLDSDGRVLANGVKPSSQLVLLAGQTLAPHPTTPVPPQVSLTDAVQAHLDAAARARGYDDIKSAVTYADEPSVPRFQAEGQAFRTWRSLVWAYCYDVMGQVQAQARDVPAAADLIAELPELAL